MIGDMQLCASPFMTETVEDWSEVRSPSRAARRRRQGHRQRIRYVERPKQQVIVFGNSIIFAHPDIIERVRAQIPERRPLHRPF